VGKLHEIIIQELIIQIFSEGDFTKFLFLFKNAMIMLSINIPNPANWRY